MQAVLSVTVVDCLTLVMLYWIKSLVSNAIYDFVIILQGPLENDLVVHVALIAESQRYVLARVEHLCIKEGLNSTSEMV